MTSKLNAFTFLELMTVLFLLAAVSSLAHSGYHFVAKQLRLYQRQTAVRLDFSQLEAVLSQDVEKARVVYLQPSEKKILLQADTVIAYTWNDSLMVRQHPAAIDTFLCPRCLVQTLPDELPAFDLVETLSVSGAFPGQLLSIVVFKHYDAYTLMHYGH